MNAISDSQPEIVFRHADSDQEVLACFNVMHELRPHLESPQALLARVTHQRAQGYKILAAWRGDTAVGLAGYRLLDNLIHGHFLYVDDLVTLEQERGGKIGQQLLDQLKQSARTSGCTRLVLDTSLANSLAQRFYFRQGLLATGLHFAVHLA